MATVHDDYRQARDELLARMKRQMGSDATIIMEALEKYLTEREKLSFDLRTGAAWGKL